MSLPPAGQDHEKVIPMAKKIRPRTKRATKPNATAAPKPAETPRPELPLPFDDGEVNEQAGLITLVRAMYEHPCVRKTGNAAVDFMASVMLSTADDLSIIAGLNNGLDNAELVDRATLRADWRLRFGVEIARRLQSGQGVSP